MFSSREDAGRKLGEHLRAEGVHPDLVLGLPRGGVIVAAEAARILGVPLDVLIVRKIGHPLHREFAVGAMAENDVVVIDESAGRSDAIQGGYLASIIEEEMQRLQEYQAKFHLHGLPDLADKSILLADDGLATGATTEAAVSSARKRKARRVMVAAPVASTNAVERLLHVADGVFVLWVDPGFDAVGRYYDVFPQTSDNEVLDLLKSDLRRAA